MNYMYEVALSFAGEDKAFAEAVAEGLTKQLCLITLSHNISRPGLGQGGVLMQLEFIENLLALQLTTGNINKIDD